MQLSFGRRRGLSHVCIFSPPAVDEIQMTAVERVTTCLCAWHAEQGRGPGLPQAAGHPPEGAAGEEIRVPGKEACHSPGFTGAWPCILSLRSGGIVVCCNLCFMKDTFASQTANVQDVGWLMGALGCTVGFLKCAQLALVAGILERIHSSAWIRMAMWVCCRPLGMHLWHPRIQLQ